MPVINLPDVGSWDGFEHHLVWATMCYPTDESRRRELELCGTIWTIIQAHNMSERRGEPLPVAPDLLASLLAARSWEEVQTDMLAQLRPAWVAGSVVANFLRMDALEVFDQQASEPPSINKAIRLTAAVNRNVGDLVGSESKVRDCFNRFRSVAHYWAAHVLFNTLNAEAGVDVGGAVHGNELNIRIDEILERTNDRDEIDQRFGMPLEQFLAVADIILNTCETRGPLARDRTETTILSRDVAWTTDGIDLPQTVVPVSDEWAHRLDREIDHFVRDPRRRIEKGR